MTTIIRYKDEVVCDSVYVSNAGGMVHKTEQGVKLYKHPHFNALIGVSGFLDKPRYDLLMVHLGQFLLDLKTYPESNPNFDELVDEIREHYKEKVRDLSAFNAIIVTKKLTAVLQLTYKPFSAATVSIVGSSTPVGVGTGNDVTAKHEVLSKLYHRDLTATDLVNISTTFDSFSGGQLYRIDLSNLGEL